MRENSEVAMFDVNRWLLEVWMGSEPTVFVTRSVNVMFGNYG